MNHKQGRIWIFLLIVFIFGCTFSSSKGGKAYTDGSGKTIHLGGPETFRYWAGGEPSSDTEIPHGQYWSSNHFTKEYILYLEIKAPWVKDFAYENGLHRADSVWTIPNDAPNWFKTPTDHDAWQGDQGSMYFIDKTTGHMYMYEIQL